MERRIVVYAPLGQDAPLAARVLASAGIESAQADSEARLIELLAEGAGALLLVEEVLATPALQQALDRFMAQQPPWSDLPLLLLTRPGANSLEVQRAIERLGNVTLLERPVRTGALISTARSALRARERQYQVRALNRRKDEFLATLAHELRNPLAPIRNAMGIVERLHPTPQVAQLAGMVNRQVDHLRRLVDDLLDVARITSGKLTLQLTLTTVQRVVSHALEIAGADIQAKGHRLTVDQPRDEVVLRADPVRLVQSLANLLVNAAKFTPPSGDIVLAVRVDDVVVEFSVTDTGKGLAPGSAPALFEMFAQAQATGEPATGLGLGLHLTRAFAELHGGQVSASSPGLGRGSRFLLRLPVVVQPTALPAAVGTEGALRLPAKVLVVDDNPDAADTLETLLALHGVQVQVARDGAQAVAAVREQAPDVVVMDIGMPVMDGYQAARTIRADRASPQPVLIALTGWGQYADKQRAADAGFEYHFVKPLDFDELLGCLSGLAGAPG